MSLPSNKRGQILLTTSFISVGNNIVLVVGQKEYKSWDLVKAARLGKQHLPRDLLSFHLEFREELMEFGKGCGTCGKFYSDSSLFHLSSKLQQRKKVGTKIKEEEPTTTRSKILGS
jgi:hypothetical protein